MVTALRLYWPLQVRGAVFSFSGASPCQGGQNVFRMATLRTATIFRYWFVTSDSSVSFLFAPIRYSIMYSLTTQRYRTYALFICLHLWSLRVCTDIYMCLFDAGVSDPTELSLFSPEHVFFMYPSAELSNLFTASTCLNPRSLRACTERRRGSARGCEAPLAVVSDSYSTYL